MKKVAVIISILFCSITANSQITVTSDSLVYCKWESLKGAYIPVRSIREDMKIEIDKDLMTIKVTGRTQDRAYIEKAFIIEFREMNGSADKWLFQGIDKNCGLFTITLDRIGKKISFITAGRQEGLDTPLEMFYYSITDIKIEMDAINRHLKEKAENVSPVSRN